MTKMMLTFTLILLSVFDADLISGHSEPTKSVLVIHSFLQDQETEAEREFKRTMDQWIGRSKQELLINSGPPSSSYPDGNGGELMTYEEVKKFYMPSSERYQYLTMITTFYVDKNSKIYHWKFKKTIE